MPIAESQAGLSGNCLKFPAGSGEIETMVKSIIPAAAAVNRKPVLWPEESGPRGPAPDSPYARHLLEIQDRARGIYAAVFNDTSAAAAKVRKAFPVQGDAGHNYTLRFALSPDSVYVPALSKEPPAIRFVPDGSGFGLFCQRGDKYDFVGRAALPARNGRNIQAESAVPTLNYGRQMAARLAKALTSNPIDKWELIFRADGRLLTSARPLISFGEDYFLRGERFLGEAPAARWPGVFAIDYYTFLHKTICSLNEPADPDVPGLRLYNDKQRNCLVAAAATLLLGMALQPQAADILDFLELKNGPLLREVLSADQRTMVSRAFHSAHKA